MTGRSWITWVFRPTVLVLMVACLASGVVQLGHSLVPSWDGGYLIWLAALAALLAYYSSRSINRQAFNAPSPWVVGIAELLVLLIVTQLAVDIVDGHAPVQHGSVYLDGKALLFYLLIAGSWLAAMSASRALDGVAEEPQSGTLYVSPADRLTTRFLQGGTLLVLLTGMAVVQPRHLFDRSRGPVSVLLLNVLLYFLLGIVLVAHIRYERLQAGWQRQGLAVAAELSGRWIRYSLALLAMAAVIALIVPTGYTSGPFQAVHDGLSALGSTLASWLARLGGPFGQKPTSLPRIKPPPGFKVPPGIHLPHRTSHVGGKVNADWLGSLFFWLAIVAAMVYLIRIHLQQRMGRSGPGGAIGRLLRVAGMLWRALLARLRRYARRAVEMAPAGIALQRPAFGGGSSRLRLRLLGRLSPRERILYYYLSAERRAARQGAGRRTGQTPYEYDDALGARMPGAQSDLSALTGAFVAARYSRRDPPAEEASALHDNWQRVKAAIRRLRR